MDCFLFPEGIVLKAVRQSQFPALQRYLKEARLPIDPETDVTLSSDAGFLESLGFENWQSVRRQVHLFLCTHGQRDSRCGKWGGALYEHLRRTAEAKDGAGLSWKSLLRVQNERVYEPGIVHVWKTSHIGGHQFAGNLL